MRGEAADGASAAFAVLVMHSAVGGDAADGAEDRVRCAVGIRRAGQFAGAAFAVGVVASGTIQLVTGVDPAVRGEIADQLAAASAFYTVTFSTERHMLRLFAGLMARRGNGHVLLRAAAVFTFERERDRLGTGGLLRKLFVGGPAVRGLRLEDVGAFAALDGIGSGRRHCL